MELLLALLCGILMGAFNLGFFALGWYAHSKREEKTGIELNDHNKETVKDIAEWLNFRG